MGAEGVSYTPRPGGLWLAGVNDKTINLLVDALRKVIGDHNAPSDCYSSGPFHGGAMDDVCPSCEALRILERLK